MLLTTEPQRRNLLLKFMNYKKTFVRNWAIFQSNSVHLWLLVLSLVCNMEDHMQTQRLQIELLWGRMMKDCCSGSYHMTCEGINSTCIMYAYLLQNLDLLLHMANSFVICWTSSFLKPLVIKSLRVYMQQLIFKLLEWSNTKFL